MSTTVSSIQAASIKVSSSGTVITKILKGSISVVISALAAAAEEDISLTITGATAGDMIFLSPLNASMETGVAIIAVWVSAADTVKVRISNVNAAAALTGSTQNWQYCIIRS